MIVQLPNGDQIDVPDNATDAQINQMLANLQTFKVTDPQTGQKLKLTGDSPPTEGELEQIFSDVSNQSDTITARAKGRQFTFPAGTTRQQMGDAIDEFFQSNPQGKQGGNSQSGQGTGIDFESLVPDQATTQTGIDFESLVPQSSSDESATPQAQTELPEFGTVDGNKALFGGDDGFVSALKSQFGDEDVSAGQLISDAASGLFTLNPKARVDGIEKRFPELQVTRFDDGKNAVITNPKTGASNVVNGEGVSHADIAPIIGSTLALTPGGKLVQGLSGGAKIAGAGLAAVGTDAALQAGEIAQGSEQGIDKTRLVLSGAIGAGFQGATNAVIAKLNNQSTQKLINEAAPSIETLKGRASDAYRQIDDLGVKLKPQAYGSLVERLSKVAERNGFESGIHKQTAVALNAIVKKAEKAGDVTIGEVDRLRRVLGAAAKNFNQPADSKLATLLIRQIDDSLDNLPNSALAGGNGKEVGRLYQAARANYHSAQKAETLDVAIKLGLESASGSVTGIRNEFRKLSKKIISGKVKGYSPEEVKALKAVVNNKPSTANLMRLAGSFGISTNSSSFNLLLGSVGAGTAGSLGGVPAALAQQALSLGAQKTAARLVLNDAKFATAVTRLGGDGLAALKAYTEAVPRSLRSADELAEIISQGGFDVAELSARKFSNEETKQLVNNTLRLVTGEQVAAASTE